MEQVAFLCVKKTECPAGTIYVLGFSYYTPNRENFLPIYVLENEGQVEDALDELGSTIKILRKYYSTDVPDVFLEAFDKGE